MLRAKDMLAAYAQGIFPMAEGREADQVFWVNPERRGIFPIGDFHISRSLARKLRSGRYETSLNATFSEVVTACADRDETWINADLARAYGDLHRMGAAHSLEIWEGETLAGGVFGLTIGAAFFGESMFSRVTDGSKMALAVLHHRLESGGFRLFDTQFLTPHLASLGAIEVSRAAYLHMLAKAVRGRASLHSASHSGGASSGTGSRFSTGASVSRMAHSSAQTS